MPIPQVTGAGSVPMHPIRHRYFSAVLCPAFCRGTLLLCVVILSACTSVGAWKAVERWPPASASQHPRQYAVKAGDTLYSIAWRYGLDYHQLAAINGIGPPYVIRAGQNLLLAPSAPAEVNGGAVTSAAGTGVAVIGGGGQRAAPVSARPAYSVMKRSAVPAPAARSGTSVLVQQSAALRPDVPVIWLWPSDGQVIGRFSDGARVNKGIDIGGKLGDSVRSTRNGIVVYAGNGLAGYGNLVIIKHDDVYLSAYAHNKSVLVKEGQIVKAGDKIAEIGSSGAAYPKLHFEIRRDGKPVDPVQLLSKR